MITYSSEKPPAVLVLSDYTISPDASGAETPDSEEFKIHLATFLSYLIFWQDVLQHCRSADVKQTLLDHFQVLFLQQLLYVSSTVAPGMHCANPHYRYPSLLESSDVDGGSSVAVLTYVRVVLEKLDYPDIVHLILSYLMNIPENSEPLPSISVAKRRQSLELLSRAADVIDSPTPAIYSLSDLIMTSLASRSQQTVATTLRLVSTILRKHYPYAMHTLLKTIPTSNSTPVRTIGAHNVEMEMLFQMVSDLSGEERNAARSYGDHLKDCQFLIESHPCTIKFLGLKATTTDLHGSPDEKLAKMYTHTLSPHDPFLRRLIDLLSGFFSNTVETNLVLTCVIIDLSACAYMRPEGWLFYDPETYSFPEDSGSATEDEDDEDLEDMEDELAEILGDSAHHDIESETSHIEKDRRRLRDIQRARRRPQLDQSSTPPVIATLQDLVSQIEDYRKDIPDLDHKLMERRRAFEFTDELTEAQTTSAVAPSRALTMDPFSLLYLTRPLTARDHPRSGYTSPTSQRSRPPTLFLPSRGASPIMQEPSSPFDDHISDTTQRRIKVKIPGQRGLHLPPPPESTDGNTREGSVASSGAGESDEHQYHPRKFAAKGHGQGEFTLSHLLTNIMILQVCLALISSIEWLLTRYRNSFWNLRH